MTLSPEHLLGAFFCAYRKYFAKNGDSILTKYMRSRSYDQKARQDREEIVRRLRRNESTAEIMEALGCSISHIHHIAAEYAIERRKRPATYRQVAQALYSMVNTTDTLTEIADRLDLCLDTVRRIAAEGRNAGFFIDRPPGRPRQDKPLSFCIDSFNQFRSLNESRQ